MSAPPPAPIKRWTFPTAELMRRYPPRLEHSNKRVIFQLACPPDAVHAGELMASRWEASCLPEWMDGTHAANLLRERQGYYDYSHTEGPVVMDWHVNFADPRLHAFYGTALFAQDEIQVAEHPALGAFREALLANGEDSRTVKDGSPTPFLISGVERRCSIRTDGIYGRAFASANADQIRGAVTLLVPPPCTRLIAMAAPCAGEGRYTTEEIRFVLTTAYTAFRAAVEEAARQAGGGVARPKVVVHTGWWGCGAFGGNRALMAVAQGLAAVAAGVDRIEFFVGASEQSAELARAQEILRRLGVAPTSRCVSALVSSGLHWGEGDGN